MEEIIFLEPWQLTDKPFLYEKELKKELSFFHPLKWHKLKAVAIRTDRDDVLFEKLSGKHKYVVVHLTWKKESSRKFPSFKIYKDRKDLYQNCIVPAHEEWKED